MTTPLVGKRHTRVPPSPERQRATARRASLPFPRRTLPLPVSSSTPPAGVVGAGHAPGYRARFVLRLSHPAPEATGRVSAAAGRESGAYAPPALRQSKSGMPIALALSARLSVTPEPGNTTTPIGRASSS